MYANHITRVEVVHTVQDCLGSAGIGSRTLYMLGKCFTTELYLHLLELDFF